MTYNEWCEYIQFGQACDYNNKILIFVEQYNNAKHLQFLNKKDHDRSNRSVQRTNNFWKERGEVLPTDRNGEATPIVFHQEPEPQELYLASLSWS